MRYAPNRPTVLGSVAWRSTPCHQAPYGAETSLELLSLDTTTSAARRYISSEPAGFWHPT